MTLEPDTLSDVFATLLSFGPCLDSYNSITITDVKLKFLLFVNFCSYIILKLLNTILDDNLFFQ